MRYYNIRKKAIKDGINEDNISGKHQFVSISNSSWMFGYGKHACPGRFFAGHEMKLILAKFITTYDVKAPEGVKARYESKGFEMSVSPLQFLPLPLGRHDMGYLSVPV
jgi:cytochrome P450